MKRVSIERVEVDCKAKSPEWYWKWTEPTLDSEDELILQRIAEKIHKNIEARPKGERPEDLVTAEAKRNAVMTTVEKNVLMIRLFDSWGDILNVSDLYRFPKLNLIAQLMWIARFDLDCINLYTPSYGEAEFGGTAYLTSHASHIPKDRPFDYMGGIEGVKSIDFHRDGAYPSYLWMIREIKNFLKKYDLHLPVSASSCSDPFGCTIIIFGPERMQKIAKENPELMHKALKIGYEYSLNFSKALYEAGADFVWHCADINSVDINLIREYGYDEYSRKLYKECQIFIGPRGKLSKEHAELISEFDVTGCSIEEIGDLEEDLKVFKDHGVYATSIADIRTATSGSKEEIRQDILNRYKIAASVGVEAFNVSLEYRRFLVPLENIEYGVRQLKEIGRSFCAGKLQ